MTAITLFLGILSGIIPEVLKLVKDWKDKKHEKEMFELQMKAAEAQSAIRIRELEVKADIEEEKATLKRSEPKAIPVVGVKVVDAITGVFNSIIFFLNGIVRPGITMGFFALYVYIKYWKYQTAIKDIYSPFYQSPIELIWTDMDQAIFATVIGHWFGQRMMRWSVERWYRV